jgi:hypothetical protein
MHPETMVGPGARGWFRVPTAPRIKESRGAGSLVSTVAQEAVHLRLRYLRTYVCGPTSVAIRLKHSGCQLVAGDPNCKFSAWQTQSLNGGRSCWLWAQFCFRLRHRGQFCRIQCQTSSLFCLCILFLQHLRRVQVCSIQCQSSSLCCLCSLFALCFQHRRLI